MPSDELFPSPNKSHLERLRSSEVNKGTHPNSHPRDAATLLVLDISGAEPKLLMGQRQFGLKFMPGKFVFPGGRVESRDYLATIGSTMPAPMRAKLLRGLNGPAHPQRAYALAHAALRETQEETGIVIGAGAKTATGTGPTAPEFGGLSLLARAITPARRPRRFDTRFFMVSADSITGNTDITDGEFIAIEWLTLAEARKQDLPSITRIILEDLETRIDAGTVRDQDAPVPFYFMRGACFHRKLL